jgi:hypothetical protein
MSMDTGRATPARAAALTTLDPIDIEFLQWVPVPGSPGVRTKPLWRSADAVCAIVECDPGASMPGRPHFQSGHHIWVTQGQAIVGDRHLVAGSYAYVPPETAHPVSAGELGCTMVQVHQRCEPPL